MYSPTEAPTALTQRGQELLDALRVNGAWMSRAEIARATRKNRISPHDVMLLERLVEAGYVEKRQRTSITPIGIAFEYRALPSQEN